MGIGSKVLTVTPVWRKLTRVLTGGVKIGD